MLIGLFGLIKFYLDKLFVWERSYILFKLLALKLMLSELAFTMLLPLLLLSRREAVIYYGKPD